MLSYQFYTKSVKIRLSYKNLLKRIKIGRKVLRYFKRKFFLINLRAKSSINKLKSAFFVRRLRGRHYFLYSLKNFRLCCSPVLLSNFFLKKKYLSKKRYILKHKLHVNRLKSRKNFTSRRHRFYTNFRKKRGYFSYKFGGRRSRSRRKKSLLSSYPVYYSFKGLFARAKLIHRIFNVIFIKVLLQKFFFKQSFFSKTLRRRRLLRLKKLFISTSAQFFFNRKKLSLHTKNYKKRIFVPKLGNSSVLLKYFLFAKKTSFKFRKPYVENLLHCTFKRLVSVAYSYSNQRSLFWVSLLALKKKKKFFSFATKRLRTVFSRRRAYYPPLSTRSRLLIKKKSKMSFLRFFRTTHKSLKFWRTSNCRLVNYFFLQRPLIAFRCCFFLKSFYAGKRARCSAYTFIRKSYFHKHVHKLLINKGKFALKNINRRLKKKYLAQLYCTFLTKANSSFMSRFKLLSRNKFVFLRNKKNKFRRYRKNYKLFKRIKKLSIKNLYSFSKQKNKLLRQHSIAFSTKIFEPESTFLVPPLKIKLFTKKKWILKKNFEFFMSEFLQLIVGLPTTVFFSDGLALFNKVVHADRILALKLVFKRAFISKKNFFFFKNFVNLLFQAVFFKTI